MDFTLRLPIPFDFLTAAVEECLTRYKSRGWLDFTPQRIDHNDMLYMLWQHQLRDLGEIELRKASEAESEMIVVGPSRPPERAPTREEEDALAAISSPPAREAAKIELATQIGKESDHLHGRRRRHQKRVIRAMIYDLARDTPWKKAKRRLEPILKDAGRQRGPTLRTRIRADVFRKLKEEHPEWSQAKVAMEAIEELGEEVTADTVRNTYRAMGWPWERGDRTR